MKKSFNAYGQAAESFGGSVPVWCGVVSPIPYGAVLDSAYVTEGALYKAGTPVEYKKLVNRLAAVFDSE